MLDTLPLIAIVGPCSSGKSTLATRLNQAGYVVRHPAQEHSYVQNMWQRLTRPDVLVYLDVDYPHMRDRRPHTDGGPQRLAEQHQRLAHARRHCHFYLDTSYLSPEEVYSAVFQFLQQWELSEEERATSGK
jgi:nicotinamide riboside kinase